MLEKGLADKHWEADMWMIEDGVYQFKPEILWENHRKCRLAAYRDLQAGFRVVVSNTFVWLEHIEPYLLLGYDTDIIELKTNFGSIHDVPEKTVKTMLHNMERITSDWVARFPIQITLISEVNFL